MKERKDVEEDITVTIDDDKDEEYFVSLREVDMNDIKEYEKLLSEPDKVLEIIEDENKLNGL